MTANFDKSVLGERRRRQIACAAARRVRGARTPGRRPALPPRVLGPRPPPPGAAEEGSPRGRAPRRRPRALTRGAGRCPGSVSLPGRPPRGTGPDAPPPRVESGGGARAHSGVPPRPTPAGAAPRTAQRPPDPRRVAWTPGHLGSGPGGARWATQGELRQAFPDSTKGAAFSTLFLAGSAFIQVQAKAPSSVWYPSPAPSPTSPPDPIMAPYSPALSLEQG